MARQMYGGSPADFTMFGAVVVPGAVLTVWTARTGGTRVTDLTDVSGVAVTSVTSDGQGAVVFFGPDGVQDTLWLDSGQGARLLVRPVSLPGVRLNSVSVTTGSPAAASLSGDAAAGYDLALTLPSTGANGVNTAALQDGAVTPAKLDRRYRAEARVAFSDASVTCAASTRHLAQTGTMTAPRTVTLPAASAVPAGAEIIIADESGTVTSTNTITIVRAGSDLINGATSMVIGQAWAWRRLVSDGVSRWAVDGGVLRASSNLADVASPATALANLGGAPAATIGNLLTSAQASFEPGIPAVGSAVGQVAGQQVSFAHDAAAKAMAVTVTTATAPRVVFSGNSGNTTGSTPVSPGPVTVWVEVSADASGTARCGATLVAYDDTAGAGRVVAAQAPVVPVTDTRLVLMVSGVIPEGKTAAALSLQLTGTPVSGVVRVHRAGVWKGAGGMWVPPGVPIPHLGTRANPTDLTQVQVWNPGNNTWITV